MFIEVTIGGTKQLVNVYEVSWFKPFKDGENEVCVMKLKDAGESRIAESYEEIREALQTAGVLATEYDDDDDYEDEDDEDEDEDDED